MFGQLRGWWERGRKFPNEKWIREANEEASSTPDIWDLEARPIQLLFLPCELQKGHVKEELSAEGGVCLFKGFTLNKFTLYRNREDNSAVFLGEESHRVKGEVWAMSSPYLSVLDKYKENRVRCDRKRIELLIPYSRVRRSDEASEVRTTIEKIGAWVYEGRPEYWSERLDHGYQFPRVSVFRPNNPFLNSFQYYHTNECQK